MSKTLDLIEEHNVKWIDLRFTDTKGKEQHVSMPISEIDENFFEAGKMFDGSSIAGWKGINESDMILLPDDSTATLDPFTEAATLNIRCDIVEPSTMQGYERDPRSVAKRAEDFLKSTGLADTAFFGPEPEFFVFDDVKWNVDISGASYEINSEEAAWSSNAKFDGGNIGHRPRVKGGYFPVPPVDSLHDLRAELTKTDNWQNTVVLTYSEFGRRVTENKSRGTDHGTAAAHLLMGGGVSGGFYGTAPDLEHLDKGDLIYTMDYRAVYSRLLSDWLQLPTDRFNAFNDSRLNGLFS